MTHVNTAHFVKVAYHGATNTKPSRFSASWEGWPTHGAKRVHKFIPYTSDREEMARTAGKLFCDWLSDMPGDDPADPNRLIHTVKELSLASMGNSEFALLVKTECKRAGVAANA